MQFILISNTIAANLYIPNGINNMIDYTYYTTGSGYMRSYKSDVKFFL